MGSHPLSEPWLSHLEDGSNAERENGFAVLFFNGKLSHMKGWSLCVVSSKRLMWGALGAWEVIAGTSGKPRRVSGGRLTRTPQSEPPWDEEP